MRKMLRYVMVFLFALFLSSCNTEELNNPDNPTSDEVKYEHEVFLEDVVFEINGEYYLFLEIQEGEPIPVFEQYVLPDYLNDVTIEVPDSANIDSKNDFVVTYSWKVNGETQYLYLNVLVDKKNSMAASTIGINDYYSYIYESNEDKYWEADLEIALKDEYGGSLVKYGVVDTSYGSLLAEGFNQVEYYAVLDTYELIYVYVNVAVLLENQCAILDNNIQVVAQGETYVPSDFVCANENTVDLDVVGEYDTSTLGVYDLTYKFSVSGNEINRLGVTMYIVEPRGYTFYSNYKEEDTILVDINREQEAIDEGKLFLALEIGEVYSVDFVRKTTLEEDLKEITWYQEVDGKEYTYNVKFKLIDSTIAFSCSAPYGDMMIASKESPFRVNEYYCPSEVNVSIEGEIDYDVPGVYQLVYTFSLLDAVQVDRVSVLVEDSLYQYDSPEFLHRIDDSYGYYQMEYLSLNGKEYFLNFVEGELYSTEIDDFGNKTKNSIEGIELIPEPSLIEYQNTVGDNVIIVVKSEHNSEFIYTLYVLDLVNNVVISKMTISDGLDDFDLREFILLEDNSFVLYTTDQNGIYYSHYSTDLTLLNEYTDDIVMYDISSKDTNTLYLLEINNYTTLDLVELNLTNGEKTLVNNFDYSISHNTFVHNSEVYRVEYSDSIILEKLINGIFEQVYITSEYNTLRVQKYIIDSEGDFYFIGGFYDETNERNRQGIVFKYDIDGTNQVRTLEGNHSEILVNIVEVDGMLLLSGVTHSSDGEFALNGDAPYYYFIMKIDKTIDTVFDYQRPEVEIIGESTVVLELGEEYIDEGVITTDNLDENLEIVITGSFNINQLGEYYIEYEVTDDSGNITRMIRTIVVKDESVAEYTIFNLANHKKYNLEIYANFMMYDLDGDLKLSNLEVQDIEYINIENVGFNELFIFQYFTNLRYLVLNGNDITDINALEGLNIYELNVENNSLTDINVINTMPELRGIIANSNMISSVHISNPESKIVVISLNNNPLTSLLGIEQLHLLQLSVMETQINENFLLNLIYIEELGHIELSVNYNTDLTFLDSFDRTPILRIQSETLTSLNGIQNMESVQQIELFTNSTVDLSALLELNQIDYLLIVSDVITYDDPTIQQLMELGVNLEVYSLT